MFPVTDSLEVSSIPALTFSQETLPSDSGLDYPCALDKWTGLVDDTQGTSGWGSTCYGLCSTEPALPTRDASRSRLPSTPRSVSRGSNHENGMSAVDDRLMRSVSAVLASPMKNVEEYASLQAPQTSRQTDLPRRTGPDRGSQSPGPDLQEGSVQSIDASGCEDDPGYFDGTDEDYSAGEAGDLVRLWKCRQLAARSPNVTSPQVQTQISRTSTTRSHPGHGRHMHLSSDSSLDDKRVSDSLPSFTREQALTLASTVGQAVFDAIAGPTANKTPIETPIACRVAAAASSQRASHGRRTCARWTPAEDKRLTDLKEADHSWLEIEKQIPQRTLSSLRQRWYMLQERQAPTPSHKGKQKRRCKQSN